jgi:hypothetical protein
MHLLVYNTRIYWIFKMHGATTKMTDIIIVLIYYCWQMSVTKQERTKSRHVLTSEIFFDCCSLEYVTHSLSRISVPGYHCALRKPRRTQISNFLFFCKWWREEDPAVLNPLKKKLLKVEPSGKKFPSNVNRVDWIFQNSLLSGSSQDMNKHCIESLT